MGDNTGGSVWRRCGSAAQRMLSSLLVLLLLGSCGSSDKAVAAKQGPPRASWGHAKSFDDRGTSVEEYDIDGNGRMDYRVISRVKGDPSTRIRVEWDINHDGSIDLWQFFDRSGQLSQEEYDLDWDGKVDVIQFYEDGRITRKEVATNFQGRMSIRKHFDGAGTLTMIEQDSDEDGKFDSWEFYEGGKLVRIGKDTNGDGREDLFTEPTETYRKKAEDALRRAVEKAAAPPSTPKEQEAGGGAAAATGTAPDDAPAGDLAGEPSADAPPETAPAE